MANLSYQTIQEQSRGAMTQWREIWTKNNKENGRLVNHTINELAGKGSGRAVTIFAYGPSFKKNVDDFKNSSMWTLYLNKRIDIACVDKALKPLIKEGINPTYVLVADAKVSFENYGDISEEDVLKTKLLMCTNANPKFARHWRYNGGEVYHFVNLDNIKTQNLFCDLSGVYDLVPAASNVSNSICLIMAEFLRYSQVFLLAYDYSWKDQYYGTEDHKRKKLQYSHYRMVGLDGEFVHSSRNLLFSCKWLADYIVEKKKDNIINLTGAGILKIPRIYKIKRRKAA